MNEELNRAAPIAAQLDQTTERQKDEVDALTDLRKAVLDGADDEWLLGFIHGYPFTRRAAQLDANALPPLPKPTSLGSDGCVIYRGYTNEQVRDYARQATAPYAERIRHLERGHEIMVEQVREIAYAAERQKQSIGDDPEFRRILIHCHHDVISKDKWGALIAYIDGRTAGTAPEGYKIVPPEPTQAMCDAARAEAMDWQNSGEPWAAMTWFRIYKRMLAAAPSLSGTEECK